METTMEMNSTENSMSGSVMTNTFYGGVSHKDKISKESAMMGIIKNHICMLEEDLYTTELEYAREFRKNKYSEQFYKLDQTCKIIEAKMELLNNIQAEFDDMLTPAA